MSSRWYTVVIDSREPASLARFWAAVLDHQIVYEDDDEVCVGKDEHTFPGLVFLPVPEAKVGKNRLHIDLNPDDQATEVQRLLELGATRTDVGQDADVTWVVLADPEGNEFCVLSARDQD